jgi:hypothetical protein
MSSLASEALRDPNADRREKSLAASVLSQDEKGTEMAKAQRKIGDATASSSKAEGQRAGKREVSRNSPAPSAVPTRDQTALARQTAMNEDNPQPGTDAAAIARRESDMANVKGERRHQSRAQKQNMSARDELRRRGEDLAARRETEARERAEQRDERFAKLTIQSQDKASEYGWKIFPDEKPQENAVVLAVVPGNSAGPAVFAAEYRKDGPNGPDGSFYSNRAGAYALFEGGVDYWMEMPATPPPKPKAPRPTA